MLHARVVASAAVTLTHVATVPIADLTRTGGTHGRAGIRQDLVLRYAAAMRDGAIFPPIEVMDVAGTYYVTNGFHRIAAAELTGETAVPCYITAGASLVDAIEASLLAHKGLPASLLQTDAAPLSPDDRIYITKKALRTWPQAHAKDLAARFGIYRSLFSEVVKDLGLDDTEARREKYARVKARIEAGEFAQDIVKAERVSYSIVAKVRREFGLPHTKNVPIVRRRAKALEMAKLGHTAAQISAALGINRDQTMALFKEAGVSLPGDEVVSGTRRHDPNRMAAQMATDAENLAADLDLIDVGRLDHGKLATWRGQFALARRRLTGFIRQLDQARLSTGEQTHGSDSTSDDE